MSQSPGELSGRADEIRSSAVPPEEYDGRIGASGRVIQRIEPNWFLRCNPSLCHFPYLALLSSVMGAFVAILCTDPALPTNSQSVTPAVFQGINISSCPMNS